MDINKSQPNQFDFNLDIKGLDAKNIEVRFIIEVDNKQSLMFPCKSRDGKWEVSLPVLSLANGSYSFHIEAIVDGYFFEAFEDKLTIKGLIESEKSVTVTDLQSKKQKAVESILQSLNASTDEHRA